MKVVLDTNILISGIGWPDGPPGQIVSAWLDGGIDIVVSEALLDEFKRVTRYPKIQQRLDGAGFSSEDIEDFAEILRLKVIAIDAGEVALPIESPDANDRHVLVALIASGADYLVTGDKAHLLSLGVSNIVTARIFADRLRAFKSLAPAVAPVQNVAPKIKKKRNLIAKNRK